MQPVRVPLQVGQAALRNAIYANLLGWGALGAVGFGSFIAGPFVIGRVLPNIELLVVATWIVAFLVITVGGLVLWFFASEASALAAREAPSDLIFEGGRLRVDGGPLHGHALAIADIDPEHCEVVEDLADTRGALAHWLISLATLGRWRPQRWRRAYVLRVRTRDGETTELARSDDAEEIQSLRELADSLAALAGETAEPAPSDAVGFLRCSACDAPLAPADADHATCPHCDHPTTMPIDLRERIRAPQIAARGPAVQRRLMRLLRRPGWGFAAFWLRWGRRLMNLAWVTAILGLFAMWLVHASIPEPHAPALRVSEGYPTPWQRDVVLAIGLVAIALALVGANLAAMLSSRRALRIISLRLGAIPPVRDGAPSTCHRCGGPLPEARGIIVVGCVYCDADNVVGTDLRLVARRVHGQTTSIADAIRHRRRARLRLLVVIAASAGVVTLFVRELAWSIDLVPERLPHESYACTSCHNAEIKNDGRRRRITVTDRGVTRSGAVPADAVAWVECGQPCVVEIEGASYPLEGRYRRLAIRDGGIIDLAPRPPPRKPKAKPKARPRSTPQQPDAAPSP
jgi:hypothetical protein